MSRFQERPFVAAKRGITTAMALTVAATGRAARHGALIYAYHDVGDASERCTDYFVTADDLRMHLRAARALGFEYVALGDLVDALVDGRPVDRLLAVTFDDAFAGVLTDAVPVLEEEGAPATVFVTSALLGGDATWWDGARRLMTDDEVRATAAAGLTIGSHARTHPSLPDLAPGELADELAGSKAELEAIVGQTCDLLAYPFGHHDATVRRVAGEAGYRAAFTFLNGRARPGDDPFRLPRLTMDEHHGATRLRSHLARPASWWPDTQLDRVAEAEARAALRAQAGGRP